MSRNLILLNLALFIVFTGGTAELYRRVQEAKQRCDIFERTGFGQDSSIRSRHTKPVAVRPSSYISVVGHLLFSKDRNSVVAVEVPLPEVLDRPDLPRFIGLMDLGEGPIALMAADSRMTPRPVARGEKVGEFIFMGAQGESITLQWNNETIEVSQVELQGSSAQPVGTVSNSSRRRPRSRPASVARLDPQSEGRVGGQYNIGPEVTGRPGVYAADSQDTSPHGTEHEGFVKTVRKTPFGNQSWWIKSQQE